MLLIVIYCQRHSIETEKKITRSGRYHNSSHVETQLIESLDFSDNMIEHIFEYICDEDLKKNSTISHN